MSEGLDFNPQDLSSAFEVRSFRFTVVGVGITQELLLPEANRVALVWFRMPSPAFVFPEITPEVGTGWNLSDAIDELPVTFFDRDWGSMVGYHWQGVTLFSPAIFEGLEVIYRPEK